MPLSKIIQLETKGYTDIVDLTDEIKKFLSETKIKAGTLIVFVVGSTAAITTIEYEPGLKKDLEEFFEKILPYKKDYEHHKTWGDDNGSAHLRASLIGPSQTIPIIDGKIATGTWQQVVLIDFDTGARTRKIVLQIM